MNRQNHLRKTKSSIWFIGGALFVVLIVMNVSLPSSMVETVHRLGLPLMSTREELVGQVAATMKSRGELWEENGQLREELQTARFDLRIAELLRSENRELKELLGQYEGEEIVRGTILRRPPDTLYDTIVVDVGRADGVDIGDTIIAQRTLLGVVRKVQEHTATGVLFSAPGEQHHVIVSYGASTTPAVAQGLGGGNFLAEVSRDALIAVGDIVRLPTHSSYLFGEVSEITSVPADSFQSVLFRNPLNIAELTSVVILDTTQ